MSCNHQDARVEAAGESDLDALAELAAVIWRACYPGIITREQIDYMLGWMYSPDTLRSELRSGIRFDRLLVAGAFVGFSSYGALEEEPQVYKLHKLYLHPRLHGRGLGRLLLDHCEREVLRLGGCRLMLNVNKLNEKAIRAYQRSGFRIVKSVVVEIGGGFVMDDHVMAKDLAGSIHSVVHGNSKLDTPDP